MSRYVLVLPLAVAGLCVGACAPRPTASVADSDPMVKIPAMKAAVRQNDHKPLADLVADLDSDDPAVRFYAITALHQLTGQRHGYDYFAADDRRQEAMGRWRQWLQQRSGAGAQP